MDEWYQEELTGREQRDLTKWTEQEKASKNKLGKSEWEQENKLENWNRNEKFGTM
jgi:hypothetical protein